MSGCTGACCVAFPLPRFEDLAADPPGFEDGAYILDMVIPLTDEEADERAEEFGVTLDGPGPFFKCRHWNELSRLCMAYDARPRMCSKFPYRLDCAHGCSCKGDYPTQVFGVTEPSPWPGLHRIVRG